jgi:hypothetical protein
MFKLMIRKAHLLLINRHHNHSFKPQRRFTIKIKVSKDKACGIPPAY